MKFLEINSLKKSFGGLKAVNDVSFEVKPDTIHAIIGPNGAGKTTLFNLISGALAADSGDILFQEKSLRGLLTHQIAANGVSRTFQNIKLFSSMTVLENVMVGCHLKSKAGFFTAMLNLPWSWKEEKQIEKSSMEILDMLGIADTAALDAHSLPFGKQRLVEFARALASGPSLILLDEPAAGLNMHETDEIARMITKISDSGITILIIEHDMSLIMDISDHVVVLSSGEKIAEGTPEEVQSNKEVIKVYLGDDDA